MDKVQRRKNDETDKRIPQAQLVGLLPGDAGHAGEHATAPPSDPVLG